MAAALAVLIWVLTIVITFLFIKAKSYGWWFPELISEYGEIDNQFVRTLIVTGIAFIASHIALGYAIFKYRGDTPGKATYSHGNTKLELIWTAIIAAVFIATAFIGQRVWFNLHLTQAPKGAMQIEVVGQQFAWVFRYPGADGKFGKTDPTKINDQDNPLGLVPDDPDGKDDMISRGKIVVPEGEPVELILRSKDVTHSFFVPSLRFKQDTVPGLSIRVHFTANKVGEYEVACAELCGLGHYKMRGVFEVKKKEDFDKWLKALKGE
jgi:cytochrome c oxidase subunit II